MKNSFILTVLLGLIVALSAQCRSTQMEPPKQVLEEFVKMELGGARFTPEGWRRAARFLVRPSPSPPDIFGIVSDDFEIHETAMTQDSAKLYAYFSHFYGWLDPSLHFKPTLKEAPGGAHKEWNFRRLQPRAYGQTLGA